MSAQAPKTAVTDRAASNSAAENAEEDARKPVPWIVQVSAAAEPAQLGGKARSLVQLAALGLQTPPAFVVTDALFRHWLAGARGQAATEGETEGAPASSSASSAWLAEDEVHVDCARAEVLGAAWPASSLRELGDALDSLRSTHLAVRSSFADEDDARALAAGVYASELPVARADVPAAVRRVLASALSPAACAYALRAGRPLGAAPVSVLIHPYVEAQSRGSVAWAPHLGEAQPQIDVSAGEAMAETPGTSTSTSTSSTSDSLSAALVQRLRDAAAKVAQAHGSADLEWVARGDDLVFVQSRPDTRTIFSSQPEASEEGRAWADAVGDATLVWDAAHNPEPLSPAQEGLVAWISARCSLPFRLRVVRGYLFAGSADTEQAKSVERQAEALLHSGDDAAVFWQNLETRLGARLGAWSDAQGDSSTGEDSLTAALELYVDGYQAIFGTLQPWLTKARAELRAFVQAHAPKNELPAVDSLLSVLLAGVVSVATERQARAAAWASAEDGPGREQARADYLSRFGDESRTWDVAFPTWRELATGSDANDPVQRPSGPLTRSLTGPLTQSFTRPLAGPFAQSLTRPSFELGRGEPGRESSPRTASAQQVLERWWGASPAPALSGRGPAGPDAVASLRATFETRLSLARQAVALGEEDDALFARLQACVRRALRGLGRRLQARGWLAEQDDVFFLPWPDGLARARALAAGELQSTHAPSSEFSGSLAALAAEGRRGWQDAQKNPPPASWALPSASRSGARDACLTPAEIASAGLGLGDVSSGWRGLPASPGRVVGRVVLASDPSATHAPSATDGDPRIWVAATVLPTELPLIEAAALVTETGGPLGHVAAQARERAMPAVVSLPSATRVLRAHEWVLVDGDRGWVIALGADRPVFP